METRRTMEEQLAMERNHLVPAERQKIKSQLEAERKRKGALPS
jgi:hypothetical protein